MCHKLIVVEAIEDFRSEMTYEKLTDLLMEEDEEESG